MNPFEFVLAIIVIGTLGSILKARYGVHGGRRRRRHGASDELGDGPDPAETYRLKEEVRALKERLHVLERIAVEKEDTLSRQIEQLRDRP